MDGCVSKLRSKNSDDSDYWVRLLSKIGGTIFIK